MRPRVSASLPQTPPSTTKWRDSLNLTGTERRRLWARRGGYTLIVIVTVTSPGVFRAWARLDDPRDAYGVDIDRMNWYGLTQTTLHAQLDVAQAWCESRADDLRACVRLSPPSTHRNAVPQDTTVLRRIPITPRT